MERVDRRCVLVRSGVCSLIHDSPYLSILGEIGGTMRTAAILIALIMAIPITAGANTREENIEIIKHVSREEGVDEAISLAIGKAESNFDDKAFNDNKKGKGADDVRQSHGLMQPTKALARAFKITNLYDARSNAQASIRFIKYLLKKYPKRPLHTIFQMYNLGETKFFKGKTAIRYADKVSFFYKSFKSAPSTYTAAAVGIGV